MEFLLFFYPNIYFTIMFFSSIVFTFMMTKFTCLITYHYFYNINLFNKEVLEFLQIKKIVEVYSRVKWAYSGFPGMQNESSIINLLATNPKIALLCLNITMITFWIVIGYIITKFIQQYKNQQIGEMR